MKDINEISKDPRIRNVVLYGHGLHADVHVGGWDGSLIFSWEGGWEHASVSPYKKRITPSWDDMCQIKDILFREDEAVIQVHPAKKDYVNNLQNCLHIWRCYYKDMLLPPSVFVGLRDGQITEEFEKEVREAYALAGEKY